MLDRPRPPQALALLGVAGAVTLAACGGGYEGTTESTTAGGTTTSAHPAAGSGSSAGSKVPGGDNGILDFGKEAASPDLRQPNEAVAALFRAVRSGDWSEVCIHYLSRQNVEAFKKIAKASPQIKGASCPAVLGRLHPTGKSPAAPENGVDALRIKGNAGFAIYRGTDGKGYALSIKREDGRWKLNALAPTPLEP